MKSYDDRVIVQRESGVTLYVQRQFPDYCVFVDDVLVAQGGKPLMERVFKEQVSKRS